MINEIDVIVIERYKKKLHLHLRSLSIFFSSQNMVSKLDRKSLVKKLGTKIIIEKKIDWDLIVDNKVDDDDDGDDGDDDKNVVDINSQFTSTLILNFFLFVYLDFLFHITKKKNNLVFVLFWFSLSKLQKKKKKRMKESFKLCPFLLHFHRLLETFDQKYLVENRGLERFIHRPIES